MYLNLAKDTIESLGNSDSVLGLLEIYLAGTGRRLPTAAVDELLAAAGCRATDWSDIDINLIEGHEDLGGGRVQGSLF